MKFQTASFAIAVSLIWAVNSLGQQTQSATEVFNSRILPIFKSQNPSSCVQCHLSSVDLKNYILPSHEKTFLSLRDQGLIDTKNPSASKILELIDMGNKDADPYAKRIHEKMRQAEHDAFAAWIQVCCEDKKLVSMPPTKDNTKVGPKVDNEVVRHNRKSRVVDSFVRNVWSQRMRCFPCHTPNEIGPQQKVAREKYEQWYDQFGDRMAIFKETPEATMRYLIKESVDTDDKNLPLLNLESPQKSLLVLKPMSKVPPKVGEHRVPTYSEPIFHMGGLKIHENDHSHIAMLNWLEDYTAVTRGNYTSVSDLPSDNWYPTQRILRMRDVPEHVAVGTVIQMFIFKDQRSDSSEPLSRQPIGFTQGTVTPRRIANGAIILFLPRDHNEAVAWRSKKNKLPAGDYRVKVYVDAQQKLKKDPTRFLDPSDQVGEILIAKAKWRIGFPKAEWISGKQLVAANE